MTTVITRDGRAVVLHDDGTWKHAAAGGSTVERFKALSVPPAIAETVMTAGLAPSKWLAIARWYLGWRKRVEVPT